LKGISPRNAHWGGAEPTAWGSTRQDNRKVEVDWVSIMFRRRSRAKKNKQNILVDVEYRNRSVINCTKNEQERKRPAGVPGRILKEGRRHKKMRARTLKKLYLRTAALGVLRFGKCRSKRVGGEPWTPGQIRERAAPKVKSIENLM